MFTQCHPCKWLMRRQKHSLWLRARARAHSLLRKALFPNYVIFLGVIQKISTAKHKPPQKPYALFHSNHKNDIHNSSQVVKKSQTEYSSVFGETVCFISVSLLPFFNLVFGYFGWRGERVFSFAYKKNRFRRPLKTEMSTLHTGTEEKQQQWNVNQVNERTRERIVRVYDEKLTCLLPSFCLFVLDCLPVAGILIHNRSAP